MIWAPITVCLRPSLRHLSNHRLMEFVSLCLTHITTRVRLTYHDFTHEWVLFVIRGETFAFVVSMLDYHNTFVLNWTIEESVNISHLKNVSNSAFSNINFLNNQLVTLSSGVSLSLNFQSVLLRACTNLNGGEFGMIWWLLSLRSRSTF